MGGGTERKKWGRRHEERYKLKRKNRGMLGRKKMERCEYLPSRGEVMFPPRKGVAEGGQVLCEPLLPKLHPPLGPLGGPRPREQKNLPPPESRLRQDQAPVGSPAATELQMFTSKHTTREGTHRWVRAHGDRGMPFHLAYPRCQACTGERVTEIKVCVRVCVSACVLREGPGRPRFHTITSCLPSHHSALSSPCPAWAGAVPNLPPAGG